MVAPAARSDSTVGLGDNSLPLICLPICSNNVASALMPAPPMPNMCTRCAWLKLTSDMHPLRLAQAHLRHGAYFATAGPTYAAELARPALAHDAAARLYAGASWGS